MFASLSRRLPADGGPYAYARAAFGNLAGFSNAWLVLDHRLGGQRGDRRRLGALRRGVRQQRTQNKLFSIVLALVGLWMPAAINLIGVKNMGAVQLWTSILKFVPLVFMSTVGLFFISTGNFTPWNTSGDSDVAAIGGAMALCLFSYLGVETAAVAAAKVRDPDKNVPRATIFGTLGTAVVYLLSLIAVFGIVPSSDAVGVDGAVRDGGQRDLRRHLGGLRDGGAGRDLRLRRAERLDHDLRRDAAGRGQGRAVPRAFGQLNRRGVPAFGIVASTVLASIFMVMSYAGSAGYTVFNTLVFMSGHHRGHPLRLLRAGPDQVADASTAAQLHTPRFARDVGIAVVALVFSVLFICVLAQHRRGQPSGRSTCRSSSPAVAFLARHPGLPRAAHPHDRTARRPGVPTLAPLRRRPPCPSTSTQRSGGSTR